MKDKICLVTGVFDVLHVAHLDLIEIAAAKGAVRVGLNDDDSVRQLKGATRPVNNEYDRIRMIEAIRDVKYAFLIHSTNVADTIRKVRPDYWVKGGTYTLDTLDKTEVAAAKEVGAEIVIVPLKPGYSTTETLRKLKGE